MHWGVPRPPPDTSHPTASGLCVHPAGPGPGPVHISFKTCTSATGQSWVSRPASQTICRRRPGGSGAPCRAADVPSGRTCPSPGAGVSSSEPGLPGGSPLSDLCGHKPGAPSSRGHPPPGPTKDQAVATSSPDSPPAEAQTYYLLSLEGVTQGVLHVGDGRDKPPQHRVPEGSSPDLNRACRPPWPREESGCTFSAPPPGMSHQPQQEHLPASFKVGGLQGAITMATTPPSSFCEKLHSLVCGWGPSVFKTQPLIRAAGRQGEARAGGGTPRPGRGLCRAPQ